MKELSIIIPVYKTEKYLRECVDSVLREAPQNSEIILVDDGSPDNCPQICDEYVAQDSRVRVIHKKNSGVSAARNEAIEIAEGERIFFLDSDDYVPKDYFKILMSYSADLVISNYLAFYEDRTPDIRGEIQTVSYQSIYHYLLDFYKYFATAFNFPWGKLYKTAIIKEYNIRFNPSIIVSEDAIFNVEYYQHCNSVQMVEEAQLQYRQLATSASRSFFPDLFEWYLISYNKIKGLLLAFNAFSQDNEEHFYSHFIGNTMECILGLWKQPKELRREKYTKICTSELLQTALPYYQPKREKRIIRALKKQDINKIEKSVKKYLFWANIRKKIRSVL